VVRGKSPKTTVSDRSAPCPLDRVNRQFRVAGPDRLLVSNFAYVATWAVLVERRRQSLAPRPSRGLPHSPG
jgi:putative transposase